MKKIVKKICKIIFDIFNLKCPYCKGYMKFEFNNSRGDSIYRCETCGHRKVLEKSSFVAHTHS